MVSNHVKGQSHQAQLTKGKEKDEGLHAETVINDFRNFTFKSKHKVGEIRKRCWRKRECGDRDVELLVRERGMKFSILSYAIAYITICVYSHIQSASLVDVSGVGDSTWNASSSTLRPAQ